MSIKVQTENHLQLYDYFCGQWEISRKIDDLLKKQQGHMQGIVTFHSLSEKFLHYEEKGEMILGGQRFDVFRHYAYEFFEEFLDVHFIRHLEQRQFDPFCRLIFNNEGMAETHHPCRKDMYQGSFKLVSPAEFQTTWMVSGPEKQTQISTMFYR